MSRFLTSIVSWLRAGYPNGVPQNDYLPILALLSRRLASHEVAQVARQFLQSPPPGYVDIGVAILGITDQLPSPVDVERVRAKLAGLDGGDGAARGVGAQVRALARDAADPDKLARMYVGWAAWL